MMTFSGTFQPLCRSFVQVELVMYALYEYNYYCSLVAFNLNELCDNLSRLTLTFLLHNFPGSVRWCLL